MSHPSPHYLRFVRTLALATTMALPACVDHETSGSAQAGDGGGSPSTQSDEHKASSQPLASATGAGGAQGTGGGASEGGGGTAPGDTDAGAPSDASPGFSSGPFPPPEMPASLA